MPYSSEPSRWSKVSLYLWGAWVALVIAGFAALEWIGLKKEGDAHPPLTYVIRRYIPAWALFTGGAALFGWLGWHFVVTYLT